MDQHKPNMRMAGDGASMKEKMKATKISVRKQTVGYLRDPFGNVHFGKYPGMTRKPGKRQREDSSSSSQQARCSYTHTGNVPEDLHPESEAPSVEKSSLRGKDLYVQLLIQHKGYTLADVIGSSTIMQEFNSHNNSLEENSFHCVYRRPVRAIDYMWAYTCSCQTTDHEEVSNLEPVLEEAAGLPSRSEWCIHIQAGKDILEQLDAEKGMNAETVFIQLENEGLQDHIYHCALNIECSIFRLSGGHDTTLIGVVLPSEQFRAQQYGVLMMKNNKMSCLACKKPCQHVKLISDLKENRHDVSHEIQQVLDSFFEVSDFTCSTGNALYQCLSWEKIPFFRNEAFTRKMRTGFCGLVTVDHGSEFYSLFPNLSTCPGCGAVLDTVVVSKKVPVFLCHSIEYSTVSKQVCSNCGAVHAYDGQEELVLNMRSYLMGHDVLRSYLHNFCRGKRPLYTFFKVWKDDLDDRGVPSDELTYHKFIHAWYAFVELLDIDINREFSCSECEATLGGQPTTVVCDGTSLSFRRDLLIDEAPPTHADCVLPRLSTHRDRVYVTHKEVRVLVQNFCSPAKKLGDSDFFLLKDLTKKHYPALNTFLIEIQDGSTVCPAPYRKFLIDAVSNYPVCAILLPIPEVEQLLDDMFSGINLRKYPSKWSSLHQHIPILFELFCSDHSLLPLNEKLTALVMDMWKIASQTFEATGLQHKCSEILSESSRAFFPMLEKLHCRGKFAADATNTRPVRCQKRFPGHPSLLPGIFTIFCEHGVCYGFQVMETCESPNVPFTIFSTRFKKAPSVVVYDFACSLQAYCLNRDPVFFRETRFVVDRFHWRNHNACPSAYNLAKYPSLSSLNSQMNEQANSGLKRIKDQLSYMSEKHFMDHCKLFLFKKNIDAKKSC